MKQDASTTGGPLPASEDVGTEPSKKKSWRDDDPEAHKYTMLQAIGFNTMNMFGTGPLITIPYCINAVSPAGPQAMIGYTVAVIACACDSLVWSEISTMWPQSGGSYVYLRQLFGPQTWGRLASFMFIWQFFVSGPAEVASGFIGIAEYMTYFNEGALSYWPRVGIALFALVLCFGLLFRGVHDIGRVTLVLWAVTIFSMVYTIPAGFSDWDAENLRMPPGALSNPKGAVWAIAAATRFGVYDMSGYYDVCFMGGEVKNPRRTMPISCIVTCVVVGIIFILVYLAVLGHVPWQYMVEIYGDPHANPPGIMSIFTESRSGPGMAYVMTLVVAVTIFGSVFSVLCGFGYLPYAAAKDGTFFAIFAHESEYFPGLADYSLMSVCFLSAIWCFFELEIVVNAMTTMMVAVMFIGQAVGLLYYRYTVPEDEQAPGWRMPLFPLPVILQIVIFSFIWITTDSVLLWGSKDPVLEMSIAFLAVGLVLFLVRARLCQEWPFVDPPSEEDLEHAAKELVDEDSEEDALAAEDEPEERVEAQHHAAEVPAVPERVCGCGQHLLPDSRFCRMCGVRWVKLQPSSLEDISLDFIFDDEPGLAEAAPTRRDDDVEEGAPAALTALLAEACTQTSEPPSKPVSEAGCDAPKIAQGMDASQEKKSLVTTTPRATDTALEAVTPASPDMSVDLVTTTEVVDDIRVLDDDGFASDSDRSNGSLKLDYGSAKSGSDAAVSKSTSCADGDADDDGASDSAKSGGGSDSAKSGGGSAKSGSDTAASKSTSCGSGEPARRDSSGALGSEDGISSEAAASDGPKDDTDSLRSGEEEAEILPETGPAHAGRDDV